MLIKVTKKNPIFKVELLFISNVEYNKLISKENMTAKGLQHKVCEEELPPPPPKVKSLSRADVGIQNLGFPPSRCDSSTVIK